PDRRQENCSAPGDGPALSRKTDRRTQPMTFTRRSQRPYPSNGGTPTPASSTASRPTACVDAWIEDFRKDISRNDVPTLILDGDADSDSAARCHVPKAGEDDQGRQVHRAKVGC